jgi:hypothetical protein
MTVTQLPFEWHQPSDLKRVDEVTLTTQTMGAVVALMASALVAVVRGADHTEEAGDER